MSFVLVVSVSQLHSREIFSAIFWADFSGRPVPLSGPLVKEILHWRFLDSWNGFLPCRPEFHGRLYLASDASNTSWGGVLHFPRELPTVPALFAPYCSARVPRHKESLAGGPTQSTLWPFLLT